MKVRGTCVGVATLFVLVSGAFSLAAAQEPRKLIEAESIPLDLAAALIASGGFGAEPQILVGSIPEWIANRIYVPAGARVLGSAFLGTTVTAVVSVVEPPDSALARFRRELQQRGWTNPPPPTFSGGGFRSATIPGATLASRLTLCSDQQILTASAVRHRGTVTNVTLRVTTSPNYSVCRPPDPPSMSRSAMPTLINPEGADDGRFGAECSSPYSGSSGTGTTLRTLMTPEALLDHYARQLQDSGWTALGDKATILGRVWTRADASGGASELSITVTTSPRDARCRELNLQVKGARRP